MFGILESKEKKMKKLLIKIVDCLKKEKDYINLKEKVLELSNEWNKDLLLDDFINKVLVFLTYEERLDTFPVDNWVDSFFEND